MAGITLEQAQAQLEAWLAASLAVTKSQSYQIGDRRLSRADAAEIRSQVEFWQAQISRLTVSARRRGRSRTIVMGG